MLPTVSQPLQGFGIETFVFMMTRISGNRVSTRSVLGNGFLLGGMGATGEQVKNGTREYFVYLIELMHKFMAYGECVSQGREMSTSFFH